ncbi:MAG: hypothetical protein EA384_02885 [Spirochaetaceae bacterium]|nr:MAG: hypothetical protein EA384_02885 [Spirochaetaceae bacterium]
MSSSPSLTLLREQRAALLARIAAIEEFRPGSLVERYRRCGKPTCHCARQGDRGHGPSWSLTRGVKGKTVTKIILADFVDATLEQIDRYKQLQRLLREYTELNVKICDALLECARGESDGPEGAEKGGSTCHLGGR